MKHAILITAPAVPTSLFDLIKHSDPNTDGIMLQHAGAAVNFGNRSNQPFSLAAGPPIFLQNQRNTKGVFVSGGGTLVVGLF